MFCRLIPPAIASGAFLKSARNRFKSLLDIGLVCCRSYAV